MGINRDSNRDYYEPEIIEDDLVLLDTVIECPDKDVNNIKKPSPSRLTKYHSSKKRGTLYTSIDDLYIHKKLGANKSRRCENLCYLLNLVDKDEWGNLEKLDCVEPRMSVFAEILMDKEKWKVWNDFINQSEEEQQKILQKSNGRNTRYQRSKTDQFLKDKDLNQENWEIVPDMRAAHPAYTAEQRFQKLDRNIRATLKRRHFPQGLLLTIEQDLISFFREWPTAVYISQLANSFERLLLHALCQYLGLKSKSFEEEGIKRIEVENSKDYFKPPNVLLSQYIQKNQ